MNANDLAKLMIYYGELSEKLAEMEKMIQKAVLEMGKTQTVGNVRATYSNPRKTYQSWEDAVLDAEPEGFDPMNYMELIPAQTVINWQKAAEELKIERKSWVPEGAQPSVTIKIIE